MRNPLLKRFPRELKSELGKYVVLFVFIAGMIGVISGFLVAGNSMSVAYDESFEKYNIEDGNFELSVKADDALIETLEKENLSVYENFYIEESSDEIDSTLRIFAERDEINKVCLMEGRLPKKINEISIDRVYAKNNSVAIGDSLTVGGKTLEVVGFVALSDYSTLYRSPSDMMFDAVKFGVGIMTDDGFNSFSGSNIHYSYSWKYDDPPADDTEAKEMSESFIEVLADNAAIINYIPQYTNQAIIFAGNDIGNDTMMMAMLLYIMMAIIAFIFAITASNTITKESAVIGTLRASGYTKGEIIRHYLTMPMVVTFISAIVGNILGYTWFKQFAVDLMYNSFSLTTYVTLWNAEAFIKTTVVPLLIMFLINLFILIRKLKLSPLKFIRRDLSTRKKKKALKLNIKLSIMTRFRLRVLFQNIPNYITIIVGIMLANIILLFGCGMNPLLDHYEKEVAENMICDYQYILKTPVETENKNAEKFSTYALNTIEGEIKTEAVTVYGILPHSKYIDIDFEGKGVYISNAYAEKHGISVGDTFTLKEDYDNLEYSFKVDGIYYYPSTLAVFMDNTQFNEAFETEENQFSGYFSDQEITDIDSAFIGTKITADDMTKTSRQLKASMGGMADMIQVFGIVVFMLIIYLLSKIIIEKNAQSISMTKILGYSNREINRLYIFTTTIVVIASLLLTIPIVDNIVEYAMKIGFSEYSGYFAYYVPFDVYVKMAFLGICSYAVIAFFQMRRVKKIPLDIALKNVE